MFCLLLLYWNQIAETAKRMKIVVIADEVYGHLVFGDTPFVPMGIFGSLVPVLTLGSLSKRWIVPGWRLGWFVINDPCSTFKNSKVRDKISCHFQIMRWMLHASIHMLSFDDFCSQFLISNWILDTCSLNLFVQMLSHGSFLLYLGYWAH